MNNNRAQKKVVLRNYTSPVFNLLQSQVQTIEAAKQAKRDERRAEFIAAHPHVDFDCKAGTDEDPEHPNLIIAQSRLADLNCVLAIIFSDEHWKIKIRYAKSICRLKFFKLKHSDVDPDGELTGCADSQDSIIARVQTTPPKLPPFIIAMDDFNQALAKAHVDIRRELARLANDPSPNSQLSDLDRLDLRAASMHLPTAPIHLPPTRRKPAPLKPQSPNPPSAPPPTQAPTPPAAPALASSLAPAPASALAPTTIDAPAQASASAPAGAATPTTATAESPATDTSVQNPSDPAPSTDTAISPSPSSLTDAEGVDASSRG